MTSFFLFFSHYAPLPPLLSQDEDELRGALRILESLECCSWSKGQHNSDEQSTQGNRSLYATPLLSRANLLIRDTKDKSEGDYDDDINILEICQGRVQSQMKAKHHLMTPQEKNMENMESIMESLATFREKSIGMDHESRKNAADAMLFRMMEMFNFDEEEDLEGEEHLKETEYDLTLEEVEDEAIFSDMNRTFQQDADIFDSNPENI